MSDVETYYLISLPFKPRVDPNATAQHSNLLEQTRSTGVALRQFLVPPLKVGTLDSLMEASDELTKLDPQVEGVCQKFAGLLEEATGKARKDLTIQVSHAQETGCEAYLKTFDWNSTHYNAKDSVKTLLDRLAKEVSEAEERVRSKLNEFNELRTKMTNASRKSQGNLAIRPIGEAVAKWCRENEVDRLTESEFLTTMLIAVPAQAENEFVADYWKLHDNVAPRSHALIARDHEYVLFSIVIFKKVLEDVKLAARKKKYVVRDRDSSEDMNGTEFRALQLRVDQEKSDLTKLLIQQFTTCYCGWIHIKAIRIFVESVLKYGLPPRFVAVLLAADGGKESVVRARLKELYSDLASPYHDDAAASASTGGAGIGHHDVGALQYEYPYVSIKVTNILH